MKSLLSPLVLTADAAIDLQMHTTFSDGRWTPEQLIDYLVDESFGLVAITDHDRVDITTTLQHLASEKQLPLLTAVEMSTSWRGELTDVLCYGFDPEENALQDLSNNYCGCPGCHMKVDGVLCYDAGQANVCWSHRVGVIIYYTQNVDDHSC